MSRRDIIVVGASAGGVGALQRLVRDFPADLPAAVFVVVHFPADSPSALPRILARAGPLPAVHPSDGDPIVSGTIYIAPPDHHLVVKRDRVRVTRGPKENGHRPAVDPLFRTAAVAYGSRVVGVVLSGNLGDGAAGLQAIKRREGLAIVQDPDDAPYPGMPRTALDQVPNVDHVLPVDGIGSALVRLVTEEDPDEGDFIMPDEMEVEADIAEMTAEAITVIPPPGVPAGFGCPDCGGSLFSLSDGELVRFRCRVGHAWSGDALLGRQMEDMEDALWTALRALEEQSALARQVAQRIVQRGGGASAERFLAQANLAERRAVIIKEALRHAPPPLVAVESAPAGTSIEPAAAAQAKGARREGPSKNGLRTGKKGKGGASKTAARKAKRSK